jgi:DNA invertase Pin-like site-specific DNA recombinase
MAERRVGLVIRVSTDMQVRNPEGSLTTQLQRLRQQLAFKRANGEAEWTEAAVYELRAVSGKDSVRSAEFARLYEDVRSGRVNTIMFTGLPAFAARFGTSSRSWSSSRPTGRTSSA